MASANVVAWDSPPSVRDFMLGIVLFLGVGKIWLVGTNVGVSVKLLLCTPVEREDCGDGIRQGTVSWLSVPDVTIPGIVRGMGE